MVNFRFLANFRFFTVYFTVSATSNKCYAQLPATPEIVSLNLRTVQKSSGSFVTVIVDPVCQLGNLVVNSY